VRWEAQPSRNGGVGASGTSISLIAKTPLKVVRTQVRAGFLKWLLARDSTHYQSTAGGEPKE
jgi:hypothetical protein